MTSKRVIRLFIDAPLAKNNKIKLSKEDSHYLVKVMRSKEGAEVIIFNGKDGEWFAIISDSNSKATILEVLKQNKPQPKDGNISLIFAPIKAPRINFLIEKATELGVNHFIPVITDHHVVDKINIEKMTVWIKEAAEQCERLSMPCVQEAVGFKEFISQWPKEQKIILLDETQKSKKIIDAYKELEDGEPFAIMVGPEGGFSSGELEVLHKQNFVIPVQIGPRILRAETAPLAALSCYQAFYGDWNIGPR